MAKDNRNTLDELMSILRGGESPHESSCSLEETLAGSDAVYLFRYGPIGGSNHVKDTWRIGLPYDFEIDGEMLNDIFRKNGARNTVYGRWDYV